MIQGLQEPLICLIFVGKRVMKRIFDIFSARIMFWICLLFLSLKAAPQQVDHWEALVRAENQWSYFLGTSEPPSNWNAPEFDPSSWETGPGGFGYGDDDDATVIPAVPSVYIRHTFQILRVESIQALCCMPISTTDS